MSNTIFKTTYKSVNDYLPKAEKDDILVFDGRGIVSGFDNAKYRFDTYKLIRANKDELVVRKYRAKYSSYLPKYSYDQRIAVLSKDEYNQLEKNF